MIKLRKLKGDIGGIEEGGNDRSLVSAVNIGGEAELLHFLDQQTVIFCIPLAAGRDPALGIQLLQCLGEGQDHMGGGGITPFSIFFHTFPLVQKIQGERTRLAFTGQQLVAAADNEGKTRNPLDAFIGAGNKEIDPPLCHRNLHSSKG